MPVYGVGYQCVTLPFAGPPEGVPRLACLRHAASVHPEPGSNSLLKVIIKLQFFVPGLGTCCIYTPNQIESFNVLNRRLPATMQ